MKLSLADMTPRTRGLSVAGGWFFILLLNIGLLPRLYAPRVQTERLEKVTMPLVVRASGRLEAKDSNTVRAQFDGPVVLKKFREGEEVRKGQLLAVLGRDRIQLDYQSKQDALRNAQDELRRSKKDLRVQKELYRQQAVAYFAVEDAQRALVKATQGLRNAQQAFKLAQDQWDSANVIAPISGTIVKDWMQEEKFASGSKELVTVADVSQYTVHAFVDELDIKQVHEGQVAEVRLQVDSQSLIKAVVSEVGTQSEGNGLPEIPVILKITDSQGLLLRPKLTADVRIVAGQTEPILSVPLTSINNADGESRVWILSHFSRLRARRVDLGRSNPDRTEVTQGVSPGEQVCITAEPDFADGMKVIKGPPDPKAKKRSKTNALIQKGARPS